MNFRTVSHVACQTGMLPNLLSWVNPGGAGPLLASTNG
jgi:hypothetical protein